VLALGAVDVSAGTARLRDGKRFDPAAAMTERAAGAPEQIDRLKWMLGQWAVEYSVFEQDTTRTGTGRADVTYMNRGHNMIERFHCPDLDGTERNTISFIVYNENLETWGVGVADGWRESVAVYSGGFDGDDLVLRNALRRKGGLTLTEYRVTYHREHDDAFTVTVMASADPPSWKKLAVRRYTRLSEDDGLFTSATGYGEPAPGLPEEARRFDFLIGEHAMSHQMTFPDGRQASWTAAGTGVYMMNGRCVMEFSWYDVDPNLPDAATTIVRLWNRQMRRWECMYTTNRFNGILYFGGVEEGDRIVLHRFDADAADTPISYWTFHDWNDDGYGWYANTSNDRGKTWKKTWIIEATRKE
jgi:hypothetical protein